MNLIRGVAWLLLMSFIGACTGTQRLPECHGPLVQINAKAGGVDHDQGS